MDEVYSIIMFAMAAGIAIVGLLLIVTKNMNILLKRIYISAKMHDKKKYAKRFGLSLLIVAGVFLISGIVGLLGPLDIVIIPALIVLVGGLVGAIFIASRLVKDV